MAYWMTYFPGAEPLPTLEEIRAKLAEAGGLQLTDGELVKDKRLVGVLSVAPRGSADWEAIHETLSERVEASEDCPAKTAVQELLEQSPGALAVQVIWGDVLAEDDSEVVFNALDELWVLLFRHYPGRLHADDEGFYDGSELTLACG